MNVPIVTTYLEMNDLSDLKPFRPSGEVLQIIRAEIPNGALNCFLYRQVGRTWGWTDRLTWSTEQWQQYAEQAEVQTWVGYLKGTPAGYFELASSAANAGSAVEIAYFGLMEQFIGQGLGGQLLEGAIRHAWELDPQRVWVHTCTLDGPSALPNYLARGMKIYQVESEV